MRAAIVAALASLCVACAIPVGPSRHRGDFTLVTSRNLPAFADIGSRAQVTASECFSTLALLGADEPVIERAVEKAIAQGADANALMLARVVDEGRCVVVEGWPVRHE